ncbi:sensor histidine kinase [Dethiothermospora halolimnae]|uniref:sensor histidine kinase n=1 Tax=Dethiothermospora halolimnae TaxID=3114390 RepID=UPI003CCC16C6
MKIFMLLEFIVSFIDGILVFYFVKECIRYDEVEIKKGLLIVFIQVCINKVTNYYFGLASIQGFTIMFILTGINFNIIFKNRIRNIYFYALLALITNIIIEIVAVDLLMRIFQLDYELIVQKNEIRVIFMLLSKFMYFIFIKKIITKLNLKITLINRRFYLIWMILLFDILILFVVGWVYQKTNLLSENTVRYISIITIGAVFLNIIIFAILKKIVYYAQQEIEWKIKEESYKQQTFYINNITEVNDTLRSQRHDFNHHLSCIYGLLELNKLDEARNYVNNLVEQVNEFKTIVKTNNPIISALLNFKLKLAQNNGIKVNTQIDLPPNIHIEDIDLSIIIGNTIDNAIEACKKVTEEPYINIEIYPIRQNIIIKVINPKHSDYRIEENMKQDKFTTKEDKENHGYGLSNIRYIVEKYNGILRIETKNKQFKVNIALPQRRKN